ncbi:MAG: glycosyltransferase, partial [Microbacterium sp.]|nr:glycosyltransferase [Microbacterium sp.]
MTAPEDGTHEADAPVVDVVIANHDLRRPVTRAVASALAGRTAVRVTVVAHHLRADDMRAALGALGDDPRVRVLEFSDGVPSPAGPMNVGIRAGSAPYVMLLGSDDYLEPGTIDRWVEAARAFGSDYLIGPQRDLNGRSLRDPLTRRGRLTALDAGRDRLAYRLALFGLIRREYLDRLGIMLSEGVATGEDIELSLALVTRGGVVSYDPIGQCIWHAVRFGSIDRFDVLTGSMATAMYTFTPAAYLNQVIVLPSESGIFLAWNDTSLTDFTYARFGGAPRGLPISLAELVERTCIRSGMDPASIDTTELDDSIAGYSIT